MAYTSKSHLARRAINFDLNIEALRENYSETNPKGAYKEIRSFFEKNGFFHRQGSGYCSIEKISDYELSKLMKKMFKALPWLDSCAKKIDATDIGEVYDIKELFGKTTSKKMFHSKEDSREFHPKESVVKHLSKNKEQINQSRLRENNNSRGKGEKNIDIR